MFSGNDVMNHVYVLCIMVALWIGFGSLNQLKNANKDGGCCKSGGCSSGFFDNVSYWSVLLLAISFTLLFSYGMFKEVTSRMSGRAAKPPSML